MKVLTPSIIVSALVALACAAESGSIQTFDANGLHTFKSQEEERQYREGQRAIDELRRRDAADRARQDEVDGLARRKAREEKRQGGTAPLPNTAAISYQQAFEASFAKARKEFGWMSDPQSPYFRRVQEIEATIERLHTPLATHPDKPYILAHIVAHEAAMRNAKLAGKL